MAASRSSSGFLAGLLLLVVTAAAAASAFPKSPGAVEHEFIEAMQQLENEQQQEKAHVSLQEQLFSVARMMVTGANTDNENDEADDDTSNTDSSQRRLSYAYGQNGQYYRYNILNEDTNRALDLSQYALKYTGCQNIHTWSDTRAQGSDGNNYESPLAMENFVVLRLCERDSCSSYNKWGCNYNYAEYMLPMEDYLGIMATYHLQQFKQYCEVCYDCMNYKGSSNSTNTNSTNSTYSGDDDSTNPYATDDVVAGYGYNGASGDDQGAAQAGDDYYQDDTYDDDGGYGRRRLQNGNSAYGYDSGYSAESAYSANSNGYDSAYSANNNGYNANANSAYSANANSAYSANSNSNKNYKAAPWYIAEDGATCLFESVCENYKSACKSYSKKTKYYEDYFTCSGFTVGDQTGYLGPHCRSDGYTIGIGIFEDSDCSSYIGDKVNIQQYTGQAFDDKELKAYYSKECMSCVASESYSLYTDDSYGDQIYPLCAELHDTSAQCNLHLSGSDSDKYDVSSESAAAVSLVVDFLSFWNIGPLNSQNYVCLYELTNEPQSDEQADNEEAVCGMIESLIENNYDEYGEIYIFEVDLTKWQNVQQYKNMARAVSSFQLSVILLSIGVSLGLFLYSCYLNHKLRVRIPTSWTPYTHGQENRVDYLDYTESGGSSRLNSGILMMRSRSPAETSTRSGDFVGTLDTSQGDATTTHFSSMLSQGDTQVAIDPSGSRGSGGY
jgi:hypothetical protein